jgi:hypothetical protein
MKSDTTETGKLRGVIEEALTERRGIVAYARLEAEEMDRMARNTERDALDKARQLVPEAGGDAALLQVRAALAWMDDEFAKIDALEGIREASRNLQRDEVTWQAFERIVQALNLG